MSAPETRYLVDTNALSQLRRQRRASKFFRANAMIPSEVLHEADGFPDGRSTKADRVLHHAIGFAVSDDGHGDVPPDDTNLINLYLNQGSADPLMVACALNARDREAQHLDPLEWAIVTGDKAVRAKADEFKVRVLTSAQFADLIDRSEST